MRTSNYLYLLLIPAMTAWASASTREDSNLYDSSDPGHENEAVIHNEEANFEAPNHELNLDESVSRGESSDPSPPSFDSMDDEFVVPGAKSEASSDTVKTYSRRDLEIQLSREGDLSQEADYEAFSKNKAMEVLHRRAWLAYKLQDYLRAENLYVEMLTAPCSDDDRKKAYWILADFYQKTSQYLKSMSVFEHYLKSFPDDERCPEIHIKLGLLYRHFGDYQTAVDKFFNVLKLSFLIPKDKLEEYRMLSERAQFEIAETYYLIGDYHHADEFFERVRRVSTDPEVQAEARVKKAYANLLLGNYGTVINVLESFDNDHPGNGFIPNTRFLLASAYYKTGQKDRARREIFNLFSKDIRPMDEPTWNYWMQRIGNQLANDFFNEGEFESAHKLYHALLPLHDSSEWRWPIIFQIGQCMEGQEKREEAMEVYAELMNLMKGYDSFNKDNVERMNKLRESIQIRYDQLRWETDFDNSLEQIKQKT